MALFRYSVGDRVRRGAGQSAVKIAAYQARARYTDERTGYLYNFDPGERQSAVVAAANYIDREDGYGDARKPALHVELYAPEDAPTWARGAENIERFWNAAERAERRQDAQVAERIIIALPSELTLEQNVQLLQEHIKEFTGQGRVVQVAVHAPEKGDERNIHAHLLVSSRGVDVNGFKASKADGQQRYLYRRQYVEGLRASWSEATNRHLSRHGHTEQVDHRSLKDQGIDREPGRHLGPGDSRRERQGEPTAAGEINREIAARNTEQRGLRERTPAIDRAVAQKDAERHVLVAKLRQDSIVDRVPSGWREATVYDVARQLSPSYEKAEKEVRKVQNAIEKMDFAATQRERDKMSHEYKSEVRWQQLSKTRRVLHKIGWRDSTIADHNKQAEKAGYVANKMKTKRWALGGDLNRAERLAKQEFEKVRPQAEAVLQVRKQKATAAREGLSAIQKEEEALRPKQTAAQRHSQRRGRY